MRRAAAILALALAGCTASAQDGDKDARDLAELLAGRTAGAPQRCINPNGSNSAVPVGNRVVYRDGDRLWVNQPLDACPSIHGDPILVVETFGSQICQNDRFSTIQRGTSGIPGPYCRFGTFVPYSRAR